MFESNLNKISRGRNKSKEQKTAFENIKLLYESREAVTKLFNDYSSEAKYKTIHGKGIQSMLARVACVVKVSDREVFDHSNLKILSQKQMLQKILIALAQVKADNTSENLLNEIRKIIYSLYQLKEIAKKVYINIMNLRKL